MILTLCLYGLIFGKWNLNKNVGYLLYIPQVVSPIQCTEYPYSLLITTTTWEYYQIVSCHGPLKLTYFAIKQIDYWDFYAEHSIIAHLI